MSALRPELVAALESLFPIARIETLAADASTRRFHRVWLASSETRVVMDYGKAFLGETDDVRLARLFEGASLPVAHVLAILPEAGALVLEDLGDDTLESCLERVGAVGTPARGDLYRSAVRLAVEIATRGTEALRKSDRAAGPVLDAERFLFEMAFFLEHYVGSYLGRRSVSAGLREVAKHLAHLVAAHPRVLCHRDYHSRNIMVRPGAALALVDIQDARWGPDTYDLASLLRDAYVDMDDGEVEDLLSGYLEACVIAADRAAIRARFHLVAAQRMIKALGTFGYQTVVMKRERYRTAMSRTEARLRRLLPEQIETAPLVEFIGR